MYKTIEEAIKRDPTLQDTNPNDISIPERFDAKAFYDLATDYRRFRGSNGRTNEMKISRVQGFQGVLDIWYHNYDESQREGIRKASSRLFGEISRLDEKKEDGSFKVPQERGYTAHERISWFYNGSGLTIPKSVRRKIDDDIKKWSGKSL